jgi:teichuronic acid biosynthesis glycosyltransferase TuaC
MKRPMPHPLRTLLFSTLYPSSVAPSHGIFVETRLRELLRSGGVDSRVIAPVPWFPSTHPRFGRYAKWAAVPTRETRHGIDVLHPRYALAPKIGMTAAPLALALASIGPARRLIAQGFDFEVIDAHYFYPDGVAAALLARWLGKPLVITARGTDLNLIPRLRLPGAMTRWAARTADASAGVCAALVDVLRSWGIDESRLHVLRNGVDLHRFYPLDRAAARAELQIDGSPLLLSVGHLIERKGHHLVIEALAAMRTEQPHARLAIVGEGDERAALEALARDRGVSQRVRFVGPVLNERLAAWYSAADMLVLASSREGWANVLLEAMACGTPVVASNVWGTPEVVAAPEAGELMAEHTAGGVVQAVERVLARGADRAATRRYAERFSWDETSQRQLALFRSLVESRSGRASSVATAAAARAAD